MVNHRIFDLFSLHVQLCTAGALSVLPKLFEMEKSKRFLISSNVVADAEAIQATLDFAKDHRMMVEPACGAVSFLCTGFSKFMALCPAN